MPFKKYRPRVSPELKQLCAALFMHSDSKAQKDHPRIGTSSSGVDLTQFFLHTFRKGFVDKTLLRPN